MYFHMFSFLIEIHRLDAIQAQHLTPNSHLQILDHQNWGVLSLFCSRSKTWLTEVDFLSQSLAWWLSGQTWFSIRDSAATLICGWCWLCKACAIVIILCSWWRQVCGQLGCVFFMVPPVLHTQTSLDPSLPSHSERTFWDNEPSTAC